MKAKPRRLPQGPDPTGITVLNQCWELGSSVGSIVTCSVGHPSDGFVRIPASQWADGAKHHWPGTGGGTNDRRDSQRYCRLMDEHAREPLPWLRRLRYQLGRVLCGRRPFAPYLDRERWDSRCLNGKGLNGSGGHDDTDESPIEIVYSRPETSRDGSGSVGLHR